MIRLLQITRGPYFKRLSYSNTKKRKEAAKSCSVVGFFALVYVFRSICKYSWRSITRYDK